MVSRTHISLTFSPTFTLRLCLYLSTTVSSVATQQRPVSCNQLEMRMLFPDCLQPTSLGWADSELTSINIAYLTIWQFIIKYYTSCNKFQLTPGLLTKWKRNDWVVNRKEKAKHNSALRFLFADEWLRPSSVITQERRNFLQEL